MIDRIEIYQTELGALRIVFVYDDGCEDCHSVYQHDQIDRVMEFMSTQPEPEAVLVELRQIGNLTLH